MKPLFRQRERRKEVKLVGSQLIKPGLTLFECNLSSGKISPAKYYKHEAQLLGLKTIEVRKSVLVKDNCIYIQALNNKNAHKKFNKIKVQ